MREWKLFLLNLFIVTNLLFLFFVLVRSRSVGVSNGLQQGVDIVTVDRQVTQRRHVKWKRHHYYLIIFIAPPFNMASLCVPCSSKAVNAIMNSKIK